MKTYNDIFIEEIIRQDRALNEVLMKIFSAAAVVVLTVIAYIFVGIFFPAVFAVLCILLFFAFKYTVKEYEYSFINGDFDIDCIRGMRKRSRVLETNCKNISAISRAAAGEKRPDGTYARVIDASISAKQERWSIICESQNGERILVFFSPSDRLLKGLKTYLGNKLDYQSKTSD